jgi:uncharacterized protein YbaP (TraB family)
MRTLAAALFALALSAAPALAEPAMWKVSDADSSIYLFGSIHLLTHPVAWRTPEFDKQLRAADHVYFEIVFNEATYATVGRMTLVEGRLRDGRKLWDLLTPDQVTTLRDAITGAGLEPAAFDYMQPWMAEVMLSGGMLQGAQVGVELQVDAEIEPERKRGLETAEEQMGFFASVNQADQVTNLITTAEQLAVTDGRETIDKLTDAWAAGDTGALDVLNRTELGGGDPRFVTLITERNERWVGQLEKLLADNDQSLVIVGAGHLVGEGGVPELLKQAGYTVELVSKPPTTRKPANTGTPDPRAAQPR